MTFWGIYYSSFGTNAIKMLIQIFMDYVLFKHLIEGERGFVNWTDTIFLFTIRYYSVAAREWGTKYTPLQLWYPGKCADEKFYLE